MKRVKSPIVQRVCERCGKQFPIKACKVARGRGKFCSTQCSAQVAGRKMNAAFCERRRATWKAGGRASPDPLPPPPPAASAESMLATILERIGSRPADSAPLDPPKPIEPLLEQFHQILKARGNSELHVSKTFNHVLRIIRLAGVTVTSELNSTKVQLALAALPEKFSWQYGRHHFRAIRGFVRWLVETGVYSRYPLSALKMPRAGDPVRARRAMSDEEVERLLTATEAGPPRYGMPAADRALLYRFALATGIRSGECRQLRIRDLTLDPPASCAVRASVSKSGKLAQQPLPPWLAAMLKAHVQGRGADEQVFDRMPQRWDVCKVFRADLREARLRWLDEASDKAEAQKRLRDGFLAFLDPQRRYCDFHGLRHTFVSRLARVVQPAIAQRLARHGKIETTMGFYCHLADVDLRAAVDQLPSPRPVG